MHIQPPRAKLPHARVAVRALEVRRRRLNIRVDVPAPAALVGHERETHSGGNDVPHKGGILLDGPQAVRDGQVGALEVAEDLGEVVVGLLGKDDFGECGRGHGDGLGW